MTEMLLDKRGTESVSLESPAPIRLDRDSAQRELAALRAQNSGLENKLLVEHTDSPSRIVVEDYREKIRIFNTKCRDSDIIRNLSSRDMLLTVSSLGKSEEGTTLRLWSVGGKFANGEFADPNPPELLWERHFEDGVTPLTPNPDESLVAVSTKGLVSLYSTDKEKGLTAFDCISSFELPPDCRATSLVFSKDGAYLNVACDDGILRILGLRDAERGTALKEMARFYINPEGRTYVNGQSVDVEPRKTVMLKNAA